MSRIFHAGSDVAFQSVRFVDLEKAGGNGDGFFVPLTPVSESAGKTASAPGRKDEVFGTGSAGAAEKAGAGEKIPAVDLETVKKEAYTRGKKDGRVEAEKKMHSTVQALAEALEQISRLRRSLLTNSKEDMVRLIMGVAERVIRTEVTEKKDIIVTTVAGALEAAVADDEYYIRIHPDDLETVRKQEPLFLAAMKGLQNVHFIADENISPGGCKAESRAGDVDATIECQLGEIDEHLKRAIL